MFENLWPRKHLLHHPKHNLQPFPDWRHLRQHSSIPDRLQVAQGFWTPSDLKKNKQTKIKKRSILNPKSSNVSLPILDSLVKICKKCLQTSAGMASCTWYIDSSVALSSCTSLPQLAVENSIPRSCVSLRYSSTWKEVDVPHFVLEYRTWP